MRNRATIFKSLLLVLILLGSTGASGTPATGVSGERFGMAPQGIETGQAPDTVGSDSGNGQRASGVFARYSWISSLPASPAVWTFMAGVIGLVTVARRTKH